MHVAPSNLVDIARQLEIQMARPSRAGRAHQVVQRREEYPDQRRHFRDDPQLAKDLHDVGKMRHALTVALESNRSMEDQFLFDFIY